MKLAASQLSNKDKDLQDMMKVIENKQGALASYEKQVLEQRILSAAVQREQSSRSNMLQISNVTASENTHDVDVTAPNSSYFSSNSNSQARNSNSSYIPVSSADEILNKYRSKGMVRKSLSDIMNTSSHKDVKDSIKTSNYINISNDNNWIENFENKMKNVYNNSNSSNYLPVELREVRKTMQNVRSHFQYSTDDSIISSHELKQENDFLHSISKQKSRVNYYV